MCRYALRGGYKNLVLIYPKTCELNDERLMRNLESGLQLRL